MNSTVRNILLIILAVFACNLVLKLVFHAVSVILGLVVPILVVGGIAYGAYALFGRKALGPGRRTLP